MIIHPYIYDDVGDDDATTLKRIREEVNGDIRKQSDIVHTKRRRPDTPGGQYRDVEQRRPGIAKPNAATWGPNRCQFWAEMLSKFGA